MFHQRQARFVPAARSSRALAMTGWDLTLPGSARIVRLVRGDEPHAGIAVDRQPADRVRHTDFRLERPAMVTKVHEFARTVLAQGWYQRDARTHRCPSRRARKLSECQRRCAEE